MLIRHAWPAQRRTFLADARKCQRLRGGGLGALLAWLAAGRVTSADMSSPPGPDVSAAETPALDPSGERVSEYLQCIEGERSWTVRLPPAGELVVGRDSDVGLKLGDPLVSRRHVQLLVTPGGLRLTDLGSRHGTLVNGERLAGARSLRSGDVVTIGTTLLVVRKAVRPSGARDVLDPIAFQRRLDEESERAIYYQRELAVVVLRVAEPLDPAKTAAVLASRLRLMDAAASLGEHHVALLLPELPGDEAALFAGELSPALGGGDSAAIGVAASPADGIDGDTLLATARAAADCAGPGEIKGAADTVNELTVGDHAAVVADPGMAQLYDLARRLARSTLPVLVLGETGVGKELAAAAIHAFSPRAGGPFVSLNGAAIPEALAESELFGHARGAFSGALAAKQGQLEAASGGTLFLDEVGELPLQVQAKLLRVLETGELTRVGEVAPRRIDVRLVAATNRDLEREITAGRFRRDLYFRLGAARLELPPLRDRPRDLAALCRTLLATTCRRLGRAPLGLSVAAAQALFLHDWPGNVRELRNALEFAAASAPDGAGEIETWHLPPAIGAVVRRGDVSDSTEAAAAAPGDKAPDATAASEPPPVSPVAGDPGSSAMPRSIAEEVRQLERARMVEALRATGGVQNRAAERIGMPGRTFATKLKRYRITAADWSQP
jgi:DNA-binding NtrC family response regulator